jgi:hypothetical protein
MSRLSEPDDVDFFVGGVEPDPMASIETARTIEEYKRRPDYRLEAEEAERILAALDIDSRDYGMPDAGSLLDHWRRCVRNLLEDDLGETNGRSADREDIPTGAELENETKRKA